MLLLSDSREGTAVAVVGEGWMCVHIRTCRARKYNCFNPLPSNDTHVASWTLHKPIRIYMGDLILGVILQYMVGKGLIQ